jgi:hypothetical protein
VLDLDIFVSDFADALAAVDRKGIRHKTFQPGIGPFGEMDAVRAAVNELNTTAPSRYAQIVTKRLPDLLIPGQWAIELKIIRPFGDNGKPAEHWSENILHPYPGNTSSLGDCLKLLATKLPEKKAVVIFGYEHAQTQVSLDTAISAFETIAANVMAIRLGPRIHVKREGLLHPVHQTLRVFGYEVIGPTNNPH